MKIEISNFAYSVLKNMLEEKINKLQNTKLELAHEVAAQYKEILVELTKAEGGIPLKEFIKKYKLA